MSLSAPPGQNGAQSPERPSEPLFELPKAEEGLYERLKALVPEARDELAELDRQRQVLTEAYHDQLTKLDEKKKTVVNLLRALGEDVAIRAKRKTTSNSQGKTVGDRVIVAIVDHILGLTEDRFTALSVHEGLGQPWSEPQTYQAFKWLRDMEFIGKAGVEGQRAQYRVLDREIGEQIKESILNAPASQPKSKNVSADAIERHINAARELGKDTFTILEIVEKLGLSSAKNTYLVFRHLKERGVVVEVGSQTGVDGRHARALYRLNEELIHA